MILSRGFVIGLIFVALFITQSAVAEVREIQLKDGSVITGTVRSFDGDTYVIESDSLGTISLSNTKIQAIRSAGGYSANQSVSPSDLIDIQQQLLNNAETMELIKALQNDPQIQAILNDPQLLQSIAAGDVQALTNNIKFKALIDHPKIQEISNKVQP
jgi:hypothetical protein